MIPRRTSRKGETRQEWEDLQYFISINSLNWSINNEIRTTADSHDFNLLYFLSKYVLTRLRKLHIWGQCHGGGGGHQAAVDLLHGGVDVVLRGLHGPGRGGGDEVLWLEGLVWAVGVAAVGELVILLVPAGPDALTEMELSLAESNRTDSHVNKNLWPDGLNINN